MLNTLLKIGQWQSQGKSKWDRFLEYPKIEHLDKHGNARKNYILPIVFDLDKMGIIVDSGNLFIYNDSLNERLMALKILGRRNKAFYVTSVPNKFIQVFKSLFGKPEADQDEKINHEGELVSIIDSNFPELKDGYLYCLLKTIIKLKPNLEALLLNENGEVKLTNINDKLQLQSNEKVVLMTVMIKSERFNLAKPTFLSEIEEYRLFLESKYQFSDGNSNALRKDATKRKLCYINNEALVDVAELNLSPSYSLNKMFVTTTQNYLNEFYKNQNAKNYQVSLASQDFLDVGSGYLLDNFKVKIANVNHVIIPQFMNEMDIDIELAINKIKNGSDLLFNLKKLKALSDSIEDEILAPYWLNFFAFESDGNFFKSTEVIKDVSSFYFQQMLRVFFETDINFREVKSIDWESIMVSYGEKGVFFNFNSIYGLIPIRKEKEKKNRALSLMKSILENRRLDKTLIFKYYCELLLCHYYERYQSYTNINKSSKDYLSLTIRNSTFKYLAFFEVLKKLNLIHMNEETYVSPTESGNKYDEAINAFFETMNLSAPQQAMFYLGRMLNAVEFIQKDKKKTVIHKVNFNGMDRDNIQRLRLALIEKAKQYSKVGKVIFTDSKFGNLFNYNHWNMNPQEAVFFLMTGYSFGISTKEASQLEETESEELDN